MNRILMSIWVALSLTMTFGQTQEFQKIIDDYQQFNGVVLVATNGKIDYFAAKGIANREFNTNITKTSQFKIASMTKVFTAVMVMKLYEQGKLDFNQTIENYFPDYQGEGRKTVTIHQLLTYASGIDNQLEILGMQPYQTLKTLDEFIKTFCSGNLVHQPGEKSIYSNTEYIILHKILENITHKKYETLLSEMILKPLELQNTGILNNQKVMPALVTNYSYDANQKTFTTDVAYYTESYFGSGSMFSTAEDMLHFSNALFDGTLLSQESRQKMLTIYPELGYTAYGIWGSDGWGNFNEKFYYRTGGILGANSNWIYTTNSQKTILVLSNTDGTNLYELSEKLYLASLR